MSVQGISAEMNGSAVVRKPFAWALSKYERLLLALFIVSLPFVNPWVRGDGVGYYALARAPLIQHNLDFRPDWLHANASFRLARVEYRSDSGALAPDQFTATGHINNHFAIGPAILWSPFLIVAHMGVLAANAFGARIAADGFSRPYVFAMAFGTAFYGFAALWISFCLARKYISERWAFIATVGIWLASSLPVYMYFNPSWSHAHSAFAVAVFLWYWLATHEKRSVRQWLALGLLGGLMMNVYYVNAILLSLPLAESIAAHYAVAKSHDWLRITSTFLGNAVFAIFLLIAFLPTLITKKIIYGSFFNFGYGEGWFWKSPAFLKVAFSPDHGIFFWTPILLASGIGLLCLARLNRFLGASLAGALFLYLYVIGCYQDWDGIASFGNRFFVSLTPVFVVGLAALFEYLGTSWNSRGVSVAIPCAVAILIVLNVSLIFQWGVHLIPARGPMFWRTAMYNDVTIVPAMAAGTVANYFTGRGKLMNRLEDEDVRETANGAPGAFQ